MRKNICEFIINFLAQNFAVSMSEKSKMDCISEEQLEKLLEALNKEYQVSLRLSDILNYIRTYNLTLEDLAGIVFNKRTL